MTIALVTYEKPGNYYSSNMIWSNTGAEELESISDTAGRHAEKHGYNVVDIREISEREAESNIRRGMPYNSIDEKAEADHDPSLKKEDITMALANMTQEQTDRENREHCKRIALELGAYAEGRIYKCPHCGELYDIDDAEETDDGHKCPACGEEIEDGDGEQQSLYDYFDEVYDIEYRISGNGELRSVALMVACGGPNIYIDTGTRQVELYWWRDRASYPIHYDTVDEIEAWAEDLYNCTR